MPRSESPTRDRRTAETSAPRERTTLSDSASVTLGLFLLVCLLVYLEIKPYRLPSGARATFPVFILLSLGAAYHMRKRLVEGFRLLTWPVVLFTGYLAWIILTTAWSYSPLTSLGQSAPLVCAFLLALSFCFVSPAATAKTVVIVGLLVAAFSWLMLLFAPDSAALPDVVWRLSGPMMHSQRLALLMGLALILSISLLLNLEKFALDVPTIMLSATSVVFVVTLLATNTRAFTVFTLVTIWFLVFAKLRWPGRIILTSVTVLLLALGALSLQLIFGLVSRNAVQDQSLTGRLPLWEWTVEMIAQRPWQGFGFATFGTDLTRPATTSWVAPHAHNTWLNAVFETGVIGGVLLTSFLVACVRDGVIRRNDRPERVSYLLGPTIFTILCGTTGLIVGGRLTTPFAILLLLALQTARENSTSARGWVARASSGVGALLRRARGS